MADKQQNIFVNFKYQTAELEKGTQLVDRANAANNRLQQSAQDVGKKTASGYREATQSIASMQLQLARLKAQTELATNPARVKQLSDQYKQLKADLDKATKAAFDNSKAIKEVGEQANKTNNILGKVGTAISLAFAVEVTRRVVDFALGLATIAGNAAGVDRAFKRTFPDAVFLLEDLRKATHGAVTDFELMQRTLQATNLGVSVKQLPQLFEFAAARAQQTGESVDYLVDSIVRGIGRKSPLILDNLGISAIRLKQEFNGASIAAQSVGDVTAAVARIASEELKKMGGFAETSATQVSKIKVELSQLELEFAKASAPATNFFLRMIQNALEGARVLVQLRGNIFGFSDQLLKNEQKTIAMQDAMRVRTQAETDKALQDQQKKIDFVQQELNSRVQIINTYKSEISANKERLELLQKVSDHRLSGVDQAKLFNKEIEYGNATFNERIGMRIDFFKQSDKEIESLKNQNKALASNIVIVSETNKILGQYLTSVENTTEEEKEQLGIIERKKAEIEAIQDAIEKTNKSSDLSSRKTVGALVTQLAIAQAELKELTEGAANIKFDVKFNLKKDKILSDFESMVNLTVGFGGIPVPVTPFIPKDELDKLEDAFNDAKGQLVSGGIDIGADLLKSVEESELASLRNRMNNLKNFYDEQILLAGNNEKAKEQFRLKEEQETAKLQKRMAEKEKNIRRFNIIIDTAASIAKTAAQLGFPAAIPFIALAVAQGAAQLAIVNRTPARFAKGGINIQGPGTGTSDSIPARISKGESVMTAKETKSSMGILKDIRAKKLDDKVLQDLKLSREGVTYQPMDDSRIVKKLDDVIKNQPDIVSINGKLYKEFKKSATDRTRTRLKVMG